MAATTTPILPSEFEELIISDDETVCVSLVKLVRFWIKLWQYVKWEHADGGASGELSASYKAMVCDAFSECDQAAAIENPIIES